MKFIYVMDENARDSMLEMGFKFIMFDQANYFWVFENNDPKSTDQTFDFPHIFSDTLRFGAEVPTGSMTQN